MERLRFIFAQCLSYIFHPGLMPTLGVLITFFALPENFAAPFVINVLVVVFLGTYVGPLIGIVVLRFTGVITSVHLIKREERTYPYIIGAASMMATGNHLENSGMPVEITLSIYLSGLIVVLTTILLPFFKSSAHAAGIFAIYALYICLHQRYGVGEVKYLILGAALIGALAWSRLELRRHTLQELLSGAMIGFIPMYLLLSK